MRSPVLSYLDTLHARYSGIKEGKVADYIPELAKASPDAFGICLATRDGHLYEVGDTRQKFTIQSISKALTYGLALEDRGEEHVLSRIGVEPSGEAFNAISLQEGTGAPYNPMINAGAIATCGQVLVKDGQTRIQRIIAYLSKFAGQKLEVDEAVYRSESETGHRNRAIGWLLRNFDIVDEDPHDILETYFQQCAISVTCADLAVMAATLANRGINPLTGERAIAQEFVDNVLGVMATCGMYDWSGEWIYRVGLPAKSGVGGGIMAVLPGQLGIGVFSPPLDKQGNSARGIRVCSEMARGLALHLFNPSAAPQPAVRHSYNGNQVVSRRRLPAAAAHIVRRFGDRIRVMELQGPLIFSTFEPVMRALLRQAAYSRHVIVSFRNVVSADEVSLRFFAAMHVQLSFAGVSLVCCHLGGLTRQMLTAGVPPEAMMETIDAALEHCEDQLLKESGEVSWHESGRITLKRCAVFGSVTEEDLAFLEAQLPARTYAQWETIIHAGSMADELFVLTSGTVEVRVTPAGSKLPQRLDVMTAGMTFGEMAFLDGSVRSADVVAVDEVQCRVLSRELYQQLDRDRPALKIAIVDQLLRLLSSRLRQANVEISALRN
jgi:glutaminase